MVPSVLRSGGYPRRRLRGLSAQLGGLPVIGVLAGLLVANGQQSRYSQYAGEISITRHMMSRKNSVRIPKLART